MNIKVTPGQNLEQRFSVEVDVLKIFIFLIVDIGVSEPKSI